MKRIFALMMVVAATIIGRGALYRIPFTTKMEKDADLEGSKSGFEAKLALGYSF